MAMRVAAVAAVLGIVSAAAASPVPTFTRPQSYATKKDPRSVAIGDLNGDGKPDLAVVERYDGLAAVLANRGDGTFSARRDYDPGHHAQAVAIGDVNGGGRRGILCANKDPGPPFV